MGPIYIVAAALLGGRFLMEAVRFQRDNSPRTAMALFHCSIAYLTVLFVAMAVDVVVFAH
jgi:protoheme IX farnesyltransferase